MADFRETIQNGIVRERWDNTNRVYTSFDASGVQSFQRAFTPDENTDADDRLARLTRINNLATIFTQAKNAINTNTTFLGIGSPTNAQVVSEVQALARQNNKIIRLLLGLLNSDDSALDNTN